MNAYQHLPPNADPDRRARRAGRHAVSRRTRFLGSAIEALETRDLQTANNHLLRAQAIIPELHGNARPQARRRDRPEPDAHLRVHELPPGRRQPAQRRRARREVDSLLRELLPSWEQIARQTQPPPAHADSSAPRPEAVPLMFCGCPADDGRNRTQETCMSDLRIEPAYARSPHAPCGRPRRPIAVPEPGDQPVPCADTNAAATDGNLRAAYAQFVVDPTRTPRSSASTTRPPAQVISETPSQRGPADDRDPEGVRRHPGSPPSRAHADVT